ncbi:hypothetical protein N9W76_02255 [Planktomarina temperata]|nr:hypothetical protein [Planktomarina temperata]
MSVYLRVLEMLAPQHLKLFLLINATIFAFFTIQIKTSQIINAAEITPFALYEDPSRKLDIDGVTVKYKIGAAGLRSTWRNEHVSVEASIGAGYNPKESATYSGVTMTGPVRAKYAKLRFSSKFFKFYGLQTRLVGATEFFDFYGDQLTGTYSGRTVNGTVEGKMTNNTLGVSIDTANTFEKFKLTAETGYDLWEYSFESTGVVVGSSFRATSEKDVKVDSLDPYLSIGLEVPSRLGKIIISQRFKKLSDVGDVSLSRTSAELVFEF